MSKTEDIKLAQSIAREMEAIKGRHEGIIKGDDAAKFAELHEELKTLKGQLDGASLADDVKALADTPAAEIKHDVKPTREVKSFVEQILGNRDEFKGIEFGYQVEAILNRKTLLGPTTSGGTNLVEPMRAAGVDPAYQPTGLRRLFSQATTMSNLVEYYSRTYTAAADTVSEELTSTNVKPEAATTISLEQAGVKTIAATLPVTRNMLADYGQLEGLIGTDLIYDLDLAEDTQLMWGAGTGNDLTGVIGASGTQAYTRASGELLADAIKRMATKSYRGGWRRPEWVATTPEGFDAITLEKDDNNAYLYVVTNGRVWGLEIVDSPLLEDPANAGRNYFLVGNRVDATIWDREGANVEVGFVDKQFAQNARTLLAEKRLAFGIKRPASFVYLRVDEDGSGIVS